MSILSSKLRVLRKRLKSKRNKNNRLKQENTYEVNVMAKHVNENDLNNLLHWMEVNESGPHEAVSATLLSRGVGSVHASIMYHYQHNEKGVVAANHLINLLLKNFEGSLRYGKSEVVFTSEMGNISAVMYVSRDSTYLDLDCTGEEYKVKEICEFVEKTGRTKKQPLVSRIYKTNYGFDTVDLTLPSVRRSDKIEAFYPYADSSPKEMWHNFQQSSSNVLLFVGEPGTGKTSFIREMLDERGYEDNVHLVDNETILLDPELMGFIQSTSDLNLLVTEDADRFVGKRSDENASMVGLLNASAGLAGGRVKFIISTNLPNLGKVDEALTRPGRCFKIVQFRKLTPVEANEARASVGLDAVDFNKDVTLAEALNEANNNTGMIQRAGFM